MTNTETKSETKTETRFSVKKLTRMALLCALLCASAYISIPLGFTPVSLTLQTLIVNLIAILLTPSESFMTVLVYILIGAVGIPVFSGGQGGPGKLFGPTGGYILAFLVSAPLMSFTKRYFEKLFAKFIKNIPTAKIIAYSVNAIIIGMIIVYALGTAYMKISTGRTWGEVLVMAVVPFIPLDIAKCIVAAVIGVPLEKAIGKIK